MTTSKKAHFTKDETARKVTVVRAFDAPVEQVWKSWTDTAILDTWWAPKPWKAETKSMDFKPGGTWLYAMRGPAGEVHWSRVDFTEVDPGKSFRALSSFCDENGNISKDMGTAEWFNIFSATANGSSVQVIISFPTDAAMKLLLEMGFEGGFTMGLENLDAVLENLRK
jgi:uncharacterized protein YndB with AHSA1/START domain